MVGERGGGEGGGGGGDCGFGDRKVINKQNKQPTFFNK
jgi:hypothetical protein